MLYGPEGRLVQAERPLTAAAIRALVEGEAFIRTGSSVLPVVALEPYCRRCAALGADPHVGFTHSEDRVVFRCGHTSGHIAKGRYPQFGKLLETLGWGIRCSQCHGDAEADNSPTDETFVVACHCSRRTLKNPAAPAAGLVRPS